MCMKLLVLLMLATASRGDQSTLAPAATALLAGIDPPRIEISRDLGQLTVTFTGVLQTSPTVTGPWTDQSTAVSPFHPDGKSGLTFYRSAGPSAQSIFASRSIVDLVITGPLHAHFNLAAAGSPDGIFPPHREKPPFEGMVKLGALELPVGLRVRGNSSLQECPFPKLTLKVAKASREGTPFFDAREIKIGTHCADGGHGNVGRLRDERATYREVLAYETMDLMGFLSPRVRRAEIEFRDTTPTNGGVEGGWQITRKAMLLEDPEVVGERLGGHALDDLELEKLTDAGFGEQLITDLRLLHVLLGNWDYALSFDGRGLWNTDVISLPDGKLVPMLGDFDLASWVTGTVRRTFPQDYRPELPDLDRRARYELEQIQASIKLEIFRAAQDRFIAHREAIQSLATSAEVDEEGRTNVLKHIEAFYSAINE